MITPEQRAMWLLSGASKTRYDTDKCIHCCVSLLAGDHPPTLSWHCVECWKDCKNVTCAQDSGIAV